MIKKIFYLILLQSLTSTSIFCAGVESKQFTKPIARVLHRNSNFETMIDGKNIIEAIEICFNKEFSELFIIDKNTNIDQRIEEIIKSLNRLDFEIFKEASVTMMVLIESSTFNRRSFFCCSKNSHELNFFKKAHEVIFANHVTRANDKLKLIKDAILCQWSDV